MDNEIKSIFKIIGLEINQLDELNGTTISRDLLLSDNIYDEIKHIIPELKKNYSSSFMTCLQKDADKSQKWPLINLIRQILQIYGYKMKPIRKADGYTLEGVKKYKRYFLIHKKYLTNQIKKIEINNDYNNENILINEEDEF